MALVVKHLPEAHSSNPGKTKRKRKEFMTISGKNQLINKMESIPQLKLIIIGVRLILHHLPL
jgi:hypothetical protein